MSWFAILLALASLGGAPSGAVRKQCVKAAVSQQHKQHCKTTAKKKKKKPQPTKPVARTKPREDGQPSAPGAQRDAGRAREQRRRPRGRRRPRRRGRHPHRSPTATPDPVTYPSRTGVDLSEWIVRPTYRTLAAGRVVFSAANLGEDDHNLSVRAGATEYGNVELAPGDTGSLVLQLSPGTYTLYCSLLGHEEQGMRTDISVR